MAKQLWTDERIEQEAAAISTKDPDGDWLWRVLHVCARHEAEDLLQKMRDEYEAKLADNGWMKADERMQRIIELESRIDDLEAQMGEP